VAPVAALRAAGVTVGLGTSGGGSNDAGHLLADARLAMQVAPLAPLPGPALTARHVLSMATEGSAAGLGRPELVAPGWTSSGAGAAPPGGMASGAGAAPPGWTSSGAEAVPPGGVAPGAGAAGPDRCYWDVHGVADAGVADPLAGLLWSSPGRRPRHVVVAGRVVVEDGRLVHADEHQLAAGLAELLARRGLPPPPG
jgi:hypothetical protein